jgi:wyosine [tRNA(Phe)-imidazoG37] synthetase (radical SAM superfamily)
LYEFFLIVGMPTFLFDKIVFGPVSSRRLGISLGINLLPTDSKVCSFDCIYCECGWTPPPGGHKIVLPERTEIRVRLEEKLRDMQKENQPPDVITFAGNGEPTMHPGFAGIIDDTIALRDLYCSNARIAVLSNASMLHKSKVFQALMKVDDNIQKLDSAMESTIRLVDNPRGRYSLNRVVEQLQSFKGRVIVQTMFVRGTLGGKVVDNTTALEVDAWLDLIRKIGPEKVMIYTIARDTPVNSLNKVPLSDLESIARKVRDFGFHVQVSE